MKGKGFVRAGLLSLAFVLALGGCATFTPQHVPLMAAKVQKKAQAPHFKGVCVRVWGGAYRTWWPFYGLTFQNRLVCLKDKKHVIDYRPVLAQDLQALLPEAKIVLGGEGKCPVGARVVDVYFRSEYLWATRQPVFSGISFFVLTPIAVEEGAPKTGEDAYWGFLSKGYVRKLNPPYLTPPSRGLYGPERWLSKALALVAVYARRHLGEVLHQPDPILDHWVLEYPAQSKPSFWDKPHSWWWWGGFKLAVPCPGDPIGQKDPFKANKPLWSYFPREAR